MSRRDTMIAKYGSVEAWEAQMKKWGSTGGKASPSRLDRQTPERRREISKLGHAAFLESIRNRKEP